MKNLLVTLIFYFLLVVSASLPAGWDGEEACGDEEQWIEYAEMMEAELEGLGKRIQELEDENEKLRRRKR